MSCEVLEVRTSGDDIGQFCPHTTVDQCSDCGMHLCKKHVTRCGMCGASFCTSCLTEHATEHLKPSIIERLRLRKRAS